MGFPVTSLEEIQSSIQSFKDKPEFYAIVLYRNNHSTFKNIIQNNFLNYNNMTQKYIHFFIFDKINYPSLNSRTTKYSIDNKIIDVVLKELNLSEEQLPLILLSKDLDSTEYGIISFNELKNNSDEIKTILDYIFKPFSIKEGGYELEYKIFDIKRKWDIVTFNNHSPNYMDYGEYVEKVTLRNKLLTSLEEANILLQNISLKLDLLYKEQEKLKDKKMLTSNYLSEEQYSKLTDEIFIIQQKLMEELLKGQEFIISDDKIPKDLLDPSSVEMMKSCLVASKVLDYLGARGIDYTLFVAGYWKAIENELTIIVRDVLLYLKEYIEDIPYSEQTQIKKNGDYSLKWYLNRPYTVDILTNKRVEYLTLGSAKLVIQNYHKNDYKEFITNHVQNASQIHIKEFSRMLNRLVKMRNKYTHQKVMNEEGYEIVQKLIFDEKLIDKVVELKRIAKSLPKKNKSLS